ncbi:MAG: IS630 family transposase [Candidatus Jettenia caeni]|nr:MAG: IS630 family transposase [Candidatus Jettenia caeni]WKZ14913.1 MAG: IS630 family transposase [Candidatus Jettenia caeni]WKZ16398.1 MAG: IS630 family transposase [Candidatus Jettenia caeni]
MARKTKRSILLLKDDQLQELNRIIRTRTSPAQEIQRAKILLSYHGNPNISKVAQDVEVARDTVYKCIDKALEMGVESALKDLYHRPKDPTITMEAKAWLVNIACCKPKDLGMAAELWTQKALAGYARKHATQAGHPSLSRAGKATVNRILKNQTLQPHKVKYYLEKRDPAFESKMKEVLLVYQEVSLQKDSPNMDDKKQLYTVCVDEKPGVQALANVAPDLPPQPNQYPQIARDHEYKRLGTASILAGIDLHDGHVFAQVQHRHRSREFIELLKEIDAYYPLDAQIRIILDNHSSHISRETRAYLATRPGRFIYVHTPTHGSWLNLAETLFGKMARTFLRHMRVSSWDDLKKRIVLGVQEINEQPVVHRWRKFEFLTN